MSTLALVIGRAGSRGLPGKNALEIAGKPCVAWSIEHALAARRIDEVAVSTDCPAISAVARRYGVEVVDRPPLLAADTATVDDVARHAIAERDDPAAVIALLYANVPVRPRGLVDDAIDLLVRTEAHSVQSYAPVGKRHPLWTAVGDPDDGGVRPWSGDVLNGGVHRRQDLPPAHQPDGGVLVVTRAALFRRVGAPAGPHAFLGTRRHGLVLPEGAVVDIDNDIDARVAAALLEEPRAAPAAGEAA